MSYRLYWCRNDGVGGHAWLSADDLRALTGEMEAQGLPWPAERVPALGAEAVVDAGEVERVLEPASGTPATLEDGQLWLDWLVFLEGAAQNGGLLIRA